MKTEHRVEILKNIAGWMFATPAAFGFLAKLDDRLTFQAQLEKIVLNFKTLSHYFWRTISEYTSLDFAPLADELTFLLIIAIPAVFELVKSKFGHAESSMFGKIRWIEYSDRVYFYLACFFVVVASFFFEKSVVAFLAMIATTLIFIIVVAVVVYLIRIVYFVLKKLRKIFSMENSNSIIVDYSLIHGRKLSRNTDRTDDVDNVVVWQVSFCIVAGTIISLSSLYSLDSFIPNAVYEYFDIDNNRSLMVDLLITGVYGYIVLLVVILGLLLSFRALARVGLWVSGILTINYLGTSLLPMIDKFLDAIIL